MGAKANFKEKWDAFCRKAAPALDTTGEVMARIGHVVKIIGKYIFKLRKLFYAIPVVVAAWKLAQYNLAHLPQNVGINLLADGSFERMIPRNVAVMGPVAVTALCLMLMMCSRKTLLPWVISVFSLVLPVLILVINIFPG